MVDYLGLIILVLLAVNVWVFMAVVASSATLWKKALWALILLMPVLGFFVWYLLGPRRSGG
ncbi:MAG: hypothetical protein GKR98_11130 [Boseongicola sp.]|nr:MAG: hypothetical protein GKR98_11130 [Boseongicola sp.]